MPKSTPKPKLDEYRKKRDFAKTPEPPPGDPDASQRNLVFVVQQHAATRMHWDFRLEVDGVLKSWPLPNGPSLDPTVKRLAVMTEDHPYEYRTFEGVIPKGEYGGGQVIVWDEGIYTPDEDGEYSWDDKEEGSRRMLEGIERGKLSFTLQGHKLQGSFTLVRTKYGQGKKDEGKNWLFIKHRDAYVSERDLTLEDRSVRCGLTIKDLKEGRLPNAAAASVESHANARAAPFPDSKKERPMLASLVDKPFDREGWLWEPKLDGIRVLAYLRDGKVELRSRRGVDITKQYPSLVAALGRLAAQSLVLDGEICALDAEGVPRFQLLQPRINLLRGDNSKVDVENPVVLFLFDLLYLDGFDLRAVPLRERKELLAAKALVSDHLRLMTWIEGDGRDVAAGAEALGFEGVVGKRADSRYEPGQRSSSWVKVKNVQQQEFVVGGFTPGEGGRRSTFGALAIGYWDDGKLRYAGNVGSGFDDAELAAVRKALKPLETAESRFEDAVEGVTFTKPAVVVEVKFAEWTKEGRLRAPVFLGMRDDIEPRNVRREVAEKASAALKAGLSTIDGAKAEVAAVGGPNSLGEELLAQLENSRANFTLDVDGEPVKLTNLDKPFWPSHGDTPVLPKRELIRYYVKLAPLLLPHLKDRPLTLTRYPNGVEAKPFYQKHYEQPLPRFIETARIWSGSNQKSDDYILCNNLATLVWLGQLADLELHAWMSRTDPEPDAHGRGLDFATSEETLDASSLNYPDFMVFDLDPYIYSGKEGRGEEPEYNKRGWEKTVEVAQSLKALLDQLKLSSFVKTSGKTGLHVYLPTLRHYDYDEIRAATQTIGRFLVQQHPKDVTLEWDTSKRKGKVFFDANQNTRGKTLAAQYSPRPTPWAGVSTPITWAELANLDPTSLSLLTVPERVAKQGDLWRDILNHKSDLSSLLSG
ncbi:MAG TPA: non-homologous end-joining DNA ligase [Dehalococcoidia bacterium]|nr:non-homologous end-joining DNA ligase [Dehalococcoidia bacterium]